MLNTLSHVNFTKFDGFIHFAFEPNRFGYFLASLAFFQNHFAFVSIAHFCLFRFFLNEPTTLSLDVFAMFIFFFLFSIIFNQIFHPFIFHQELWLNFLIFKLEYILSV
jgi:hypothetical protein